MMTENEAWEEVKRRLTYNFSSSICLSIDFLHAYALQINFNVRKQMETKMCSYREKYKINTLFFYLHNKLGLQRRLELIDSFIGGYDVPYRGYDL